MSYFQYKDSPYTIRDDLGTAYRGFWSQLARPGSWWAGEQRIAIAQETRNAVECEFCVQRKAALSPYGLQGEHDGDSKLDNIATDAVHRIITDQSRITQAYIDDLAQQGLSNEAYVELSGIVVAVFSIDEFHRALGINLETFPDAEPGEPSHYRPDKAVAGIGFVPMLPPDAATGNESDLWHNEQTANVLRALTLVPDALRDWMKIGAAQYLTMEGMASMSQQEGRALNRMQIELVAGRVSAINECFY
ncbi:MAG: hypothetical protein COA96_08295 [SAR86 cluster bacterium]|uniref:Uncharacterized protein n=1 Tax=SAR86 cluster bacterium TaxID=2030880 RepID=A0A2A5B0A3_9GAMM|nr:MAG: hypothetical protein COA96_08295 [SAR86 cluster bacterium]